LERPALPPSKRAKGGPRFALSCDCIAPSVDFPFPASPLNAAPLGHCRYRYALASALQAFQITAIGLFVHRLGEEIALREVAAAGLDEAQLLLGLHSLGNDPDIESLGHGEDRFDQRDVVRIVG